MFYNFRKNKLAFTLVELIVVIAIIAILGTVVGISVTTFVDKSKKTKLNQLNETVDLAWKSFVSLSDDTSLQTSFKETMDTNNVFVLETADFKLTTTSAQLASLPSSSYWIILFIKGNKYSRFLEFTVRNGKVSDLTPVSGLEYFTGTPRTDVKCVADGITLQKKF